MSYEIKDHMLFIDGEQVEYKPSPNHGGEIDPTVIVIHYTASNNNDGDINWLTSKQSKVSAHVVVAKDGTIVQLLPFNIKGWHAGVSKYRGREYVNSFSVGIENTGLGDEWPEPQVVANRELIRALFDAYPGMMDVVGHSDVAPGRKVDPGPNYPWSEVCDVP